MRHCLRGDTIRAISHLLDVTGLGRKEAKDVVGGNGSPVIGRAKLHRFGNRPCREAR